MKKENKVNSNGFHSDRFDTGIQYSLQIGSSEWDI